jgi:hypothetical protein
MQQKQMTKHQMQVKQMTNQQMTVRQMSNPQFTRQHNQHQHQMSIANPQRDNRAMMIPSNTFEEDSVLPFKGLPFRWLRTWVFSLLALLALPIGAMLIVVGMNMQGLSADAAWTPATATVDDYNEGENLRYTITAEDGRRTRGLFDLDTSRFYSSTDERFSLSLNVCDLISWFMLPTTEDATFSVWVNPADVTQVSCIPVSSETGTTLFLLGWAFVILSAIRLLRTINDAAKRPARMI